MVYLCALEIAIGAFILLTLIYKYMTSDYLYWKKRNVPYIKPTFPFGSIKDLILNKTDIGRIFKGFYDQMPGERYFGISELGKPALVLKDLQMIKAIMVTDFYSFSDRGHIHEDVKKDFLSARHLFNLKNEEWKEMRTKLTPTFTSGRMKMMYHLMHSCSENLDKYLRKAAKGNGLVEFKELLSCFTSDAISTCLFGIESNAIEEADSEVRKVSRLAISVSKWGMIKLMLSINYPSIYDFFGLEINDEEVKRFCMQLARDTYNFRTKNNIYRDDFIDLMIKLKQNKNLYDDLMTGNQGSRQSDGNDDGLSFESMAAQIFLMFAAGFETSSTTSTLALYEMCRQPHILAKLVQEIDEVLQRHDGKITYTSLKEMVFLEEVLYETMRLYPSLPILTRKCVKPYKIPGSDLTIEKGLRIIIPSFAINHDPELFPDPFKFDPERFTSARDHNNTVRLQFGDGPMTCIGMRFGKMQMKCALVTIFSKYTLSIVPETTRQITLDPRVLLPRPVEPLYYKVSLRADKEN